MTISKKNKIIVVCHDAGGAEVLSAYLKANTNKYKFAAVVKGPAKNIFLKKDLERWLLDDENPTSVISKMDKGDLLLVGTGWGSSLELEFIAEAKKYGITTAAYLDHWTNYRERFGFPRENWKKNLPDEIWVGDKYALALATKFFKGKKMKYVPNLYFKEIKDRYKKIISKNKSRGDGVLVISEPFSGNVNSFGDRRINSLTEFDIIENVFNFFKKHKFRKKIIFRLHPAEPREKYDFLLKRYERNLIIEKSNNSDLLVDIASSQYVIGMESMALVIAQLCKKRVISYLPEKNKKCPLPFENIIKIKKLSSLKLI